MQRRTIPQLYGLAPGMVALTGLSGRGVPTGSMLGGILSEWALGMPEKDLSLKIEPFATAPLYMSYVPQMMLRYHRYTDRKAAIRDGGSWKRMIWSDEGRSNTIVAVWKADPGTYVFPPRTLEETFIVAESQGAVQTRSGAGTEDRCRIDRAGARGRGDHA